ncbi:hypothetical protein ABD07_08785 [Nitrosomonas oligotropha]|nr:hypothetical protein [Nitrosomonas oligotropha]
MAHALTPWNDGPPDIVIYTSGGAAQDRAIDLAVVSSLVEPGTDDWFSDKTSTGSIGGRWRAYYFIGKSTLGEGLAGRKILFEKRSYGAAGYGVIPLVANDGRGIPLEHLNIQGLPQTAWTADGAKRWVATITGANASTYLAKVPSDAGFLGVDPDILLKPGTENYPEQVKELISGQFEADWPTNIDRFPDTFAALSTGGLVYGISVTEDLYRVLQAAQIRSGELPSDTVIGRYDDKSLPSLNRTFLASLFAGKISAWDQVKIVDKLHGNQVRSLTDSEILSDAGVDAPAKESVTGSQLTPVAISRRNRGAAIGAVGHAKLLNYPFAKGSNPPAPVTPDGEFEEESTLPIVKAPGGARPTDDLLKDWQNGTNSTGWNNVSDGAGFAKRWGIAFQSGDRNAGATVEGTGGQGWRYIKIDGYAPTIANVAAGTYPYWAEGVVLGKIEKPWDPDWAIKARALIAFAQDLGSPTVAAAANANSNLTFGRSGIFATTKDPRGFRGAVPFNENNPVVPYTHLSVGGTPKAFPYPSLEVAPVADPSVTEFELK